MNELIYEIENERDFHSGPVLGEVPTPKDEFADSHVVRNNVKYCQECGAPAEMDSRFCTSCGAKFDVELKCGNCGALVGEEDKFCMNCGNRL